MIHLTHIFASLLWESINGKSCSKVEIQKTKNKSEFQIDASERIHVASFQAYLRALAVWETEGTY